MLTNTIQRDNTMQLVEVRKNQTGSGLLIENDGHILNDSDSLMQIHEDINNNMKLVVPDRLLVNAIFQKYGIKNANGRIYPEDILKREVERYIKDKVNTHSAIGALDHPSSSTLSGHDVSHVITSLEWNNRTLVGQLEIHTSPGFRRYGVCSTSGDLVANMLINGIRIGVSSRAVGTVEDRFGQLVVGDDLELICWDVVCEPSTPGAYISDSMENLGQFMEADNTKNGKMTVEEKFSRLNRILAD